MDIYNNTYDSIVKVPLNSNSDEYYRILFKIKDSKQNKFVSLIDFPVVFTSLTLQFSDRIQVINCFQESNFIYAFGKNPISARFDGLVLIAPENPKLSRVYKILTKVYKTNLRAYKKAQDVNAPYVWITGPNLNDATNILYGLAINFAISLNSNTKAMATFSMDFIEIDPKILPTTVAIQPTSNKTIKLKTINGKWEK